MAKVRGARMVPGTSDVETEARLRYRDSARSYITRYNAQVRAAGLE